MARRLVGIALSTIPLVSACAFLIDFDELQKGNGTGGAGGQSGSAGGNAGTAGKDAATSNGGSGTGGGSGDAAPVCPTSCDDGDPCTVDTCTVTGCTNARTPGVVSDGLSGVRAGAFQRVTLAAWKNAFYLSALKSTATGPDVLLNSFTANDKLLGLGKDLSKVAPISGRVPVSAAGIAAVPSSLFLSVFVAMGGAFNQIAQVWEITFDPTLAVKSSTPAAADHNYLAAPTVYPKAWTPGGAEVYAAWPGATQGVFLHRAGTPTEAAGTLPAFGANAGKVTDLAPLAADSVPGVLYINSRPNVQAVGEAIPFPLGGCDARPGAFTSAVSAFTQIQGVWLGGWTKTLTAGGSVVELKPVVCGSGTSSAGCIGSAKCEKGDQSVSGMKNPALAFVNGPNDPAGRVYELEALPYVDPIKSEAGIGLQMVQLDINVSTPDAGQKATPLTQSPIPLATTKISGTDTTGPDWPAMAFMPPDRLAIAWIEPGPLGVQQLHVERERVCFPSKK